MYDGGYDKMYIIHVSVVSCEEYREMTKKECVGWSDEVKAVRKLERACAAQKASWHTGRVVSRLRE